MPARAACWEELHCAGRTLLGGALSKVLTLGHRLEHLGHGRISLEGHGFSDGPASVKPKLNHSTSASLCLLRALWNPGNSGKHITALIFKVLQLVRNSLFSLCLGLVPGSRVDPWNSIKLGVYTGGSGEGGWVGRDSVKAGGQGDTGR